MYFSDVLQYCADLSVNNDRAWFHENHARYEKVRADFLDLLEQLRFVIARAAPALADDILPMQARDWMYRIARDMRFYKNRPPYDPSFRAYISMDRKSWLPIGYFLRIEPGNSCFGTGLWCETPEDLARLRGYMQYHCEELTELLQKSRLKLSGDKLKKVPKGFDPDDPAAELLKHKNWMVMAEFPDEKLTTDEEFCKLIYRLVRRMEPVRQFFLTAARGATAENEENGWFI